jgi:hypothetical protein
LYGQTDREQKKKLTPSRISAAGNVSAKLKSVMIENRSMLSIGIAGHAFAHPSPPMSFLESTFRD